MSRLVTVISAAVAAIVVIALACSLSGCAVHNYIVLNCSEGTTVSRREDGTYFIDDCARLGRKP